MCIGQFLYLPRLIDGVILHWLGYIYVFDKLEYLCRVWETVFIFCCIPNHDRESYELMLLLIRTEGKIVVFSPSGIDSYVSELFIFSYYCLIISVSYKPGKYYRLTSFPNSIWNFFQIRNFFLGFLILFLSLLRVNIKKLRIWMSWHFSGTDYFLRKIIFCLFESVEFLKLHMVIDWFIPLSGRVLWHVPL